MIRSRTRSLALLAAPVVLLAAACGDDEASTAAAVTPATAATSVEESMADEPTEDSMNDDIEPRRRWSTRRVARVDGLDERMGPIWPTCLRTRRCRSPTSTGRRSHCTTSLDRRCWSKPLRRGARSAARSSATTNEAAAALGDGAVVLALSVETDLSPSDVAAYAEENGFGDIRFAVVSPEMLAALVEAFGNSIAEPAEHAEVRRSMQLGQAGELTTGWRVGGRPRGHG